MQGKQSGVRRPSGHGNCPRADLLVGHDTSEKVRPKAFPATTSMVQSCHKFPVHSSGHSATAAHDEIKMPVDVEMLNNFTFQSLLSARS
ncbi:hypothetical protein RRG08_064977 [Elysia crispata]|uniref:Uncharacterized protein n=1 Tax=Elysia crispata TaxID=231223 RepID=A0AAE0Y9Z5_9GAST|nr:hypothetical protein RRG08_064977 [Elysia crispata]